MVNLMANSAAKKQLFDFNTMPPIEYAIAYGLQDRTNLDDDSQDKNDQKTNDLVELKESKPSREKKDKGKGKKSKH